MLLHCVHNRSVNAPVRAASNASALAATACVWRVVVDAAFDAEQDNKRERRDRAHTQSTSKRTCLTMRNRVTVQS
jgi:hypothetical protein